MSDNQPDNNNNDFPPLPPKRPQPKMAKGLMFWVLMIGLGFLLLTMLGGFDNAKEITWNEFVDYAKSGDIEGTLEISADRAQGTIKESTAKKNGIEQKFYVTLHKGDEIRKEIRTYIEEGNAKKGLDGKPARIVWKQPSWWEGFLPSLLMLVVAIFILWFFLFRRLGAGGGNGIMGNFARSKHRVMSKEESKVTFNDVAGIEEAKDEVSEIVEFLRNPGKFAKLGGRVPRGVLLVGQPGCGKTMLAKAIAGEADVPFFSISGSDFVEMFVGVGASRVRDLFKQAKESSPCIIFLDEIDAVGRKRGQNFSGGGHDEREQTLNAILVEMDGFGSSDQIIVIAATNRADVLDPALTRPGRFDRQITVPLPDLHGRAQILQIYIDKIKTGGNIDVQKLARGTPMFSGADLAAMVNEAAIAAAMLNREFVEQADLEEARDKIRWGRSKKSRVIDDYERKVTAYHEAGHALIQCKVPNADPLHKVSIIPRGPYGGATFSLPEKDRYTYTKSYCLSQIQICMGGHLAEEIFCGDVSSGASSDIKHATTIAKEMVMDWGMSDKLGFVKYSTDDTGPFGEMVGKEFSNETAAAIDEEIRSIMVQSKAAARKIIEDNRDAMERISKALMHYETLSAEEVHDLIAGKELSKPTLDSLLHAEHEKDSAEKVSTPIFDAVTADSADEAAETPAEKSEEKPSDTAE